MVSVARSSLLAIVAALAGLLGGASAASAAHFTHAQADAAVAAAQAAPQGRIFNGTLSSVTQSPWQVLVYSDDGEGLTTCGGSVIASNQVVTAAHCVSPVQDAGLIGANPNGAGGLGVIAGISNYHSAAALNSWFHQTPALASTDTEQDRTVVSARVHPGWPADENGIDYFPSGDVAVITLGTALTYTPAVQPVALAPSVAPVDGDPIPFTPSVKVSGFGQQVQYDAYGNTVYPNGKLYTEQLSVVDRDICGSGVDAAVNICAQTPSGTTCHGDSGSGLVTTDTPPVLVGLVSAGEDPCQTGNPTYFTNLTAPENRLFVAGSPTPPRAPRQFSEISVGTPVPLRVGGTVSCYGGDFTPATLVKWTVTNDAGATLAQGAGTSFSYVPTAADVGSHVWCRAAASSAGGVALSERTPSTAVVSAAPVAAPGGSGGPAATPIPTNLARPVVTVPATYAITAPPKVKRGKIATVKIIVTGLPYGVDAAVAAVNRIPTKKGSKASWASITNHLNPTDTATTFVARVRAPKRAQTGIRSLEVEVYVYKGTSLLSSTHKTIRVKITR